MEDLIAADSMRREIVADAQKKAARILAEAEAEAARETEEGRARAERAAADTARDYEDRVARRRAESLAREGLDRMRLLVSFVDRSLKDAVGSYVGELPDEEAARIATWAVASCAGAFAGRRALVRRKGLPLAAAESAAALIGSDAVAEPEEDGSLPSRGLFVEAGDAAVRLDSGALIVQERLLDERRGELAAALCAEAFDIARAAAPRSAPISLGSRG